ncbi:ABC transporter ATP-binding protein [Methylicorpusculum sp.]|uniref:ABC transporter ATP-binding protein n=1 Tax=Methylicorpusculum sp. TaxID=2713644 RepID=UPI002730E2BE|nr:ABC transporter ATP-binding protein [Methylicorpusculum sp.]MDP2176982.1 ABC transporter ATP-binding protein [Methylicorpusculum sp.]MDP3527799.1 ABC transporter ATP-binding protein [Methylicorpusculum sp.]MDZ4151509.1 ABC transporter ATP-binding protein [Methylicorpusculum sp.]
MTKDIAISVENLSKSYFVGHNSAKSERYTALRDVVARNAINLARKTRDMFRGQAIVQGDEIEEFWALRDISFEIQQGDRVGIIGRNGAGKSTLLKVLSRITEPTKGRIKINGRVASLLEVGTGFHPELSGRENIYLNGAILGMSRTEIHKKFDEIVAFAEVEKFLDTPVKRYSSGMYVRLAFAVAAHLEPEILIVDEVLAVGDMQFQKKCLGKMEEVSHQGRTVLFVSHNMAMISNLCQKGIMLDAGQLEFQGQISEAILHYYQKQNEQSVRYSKLFESENAALVSGELIGLSDTSDISIHDELIIRMRYKIKKSINGKCVPNFHFSASSGTCVFVSNADGVTVKSPGEYIADCKIPSNLLNEGAYFVGLALTTYLDSGSFEVEFFDRNALTFNVIDPMDERSNRYGYAGIVPGVVRPKLIWNIHQDIK